VRNRLLAFFLAATLLRSFAAAQTPPAAPPASAPPAAELSLTDAIVLGVVEGVTEFLPISSTGHLIVAARVLGLESEQPLRAADGQPLWYRKPSAERPAGEPLTVKLATDTYLVVIQIGAIAAVALLYWSRFISMANGLLGRDPAGLRLFICVVVAFVPAAGIGFVLDDWIDTHLFSIGAVIVAQIAGAVLMLWVERWRRNRPQPEAGELNLRQAATIGALQCAALWPGTSRSMMTIVGGYFVGLDPRRAAEFSFLLGFVTLSAASVYKGYKSGAAMIQVFGWTSVIVGAVVAAITAAICVRFLVHWLTRHGLAVFAWYRLALAAVLAVVFYL
jgi:undecaprenyl-diphosphatase